MKTKFLTLIILCFIATASYAQENKTSQDKVSAKEALLKTSFKEAGLSDDQGAQSLAVINESNEKSSLLRKDKTLAEEDKKLKLRASSAEMKSKLIAIMTEENYQNWAKNWRQKMASAKASN